MANISFSFTMLLEFSNSFYLFFRIICICKPLIANPNQWIIKLHIISKLVQSNIKLLNLLSQFRILIFGIFSL